MCPHCETARRRAPSPYTDGHARIGYHRLINAYRRPQARLPQKGDPLVSTKEGPSRYPQAQTGQPSDRAYLIRCWQERDVTSPDMVRWWFSVKEVLHEQSQKGLVDLASLLGYLRTELDRENVAGASLNINEDMTPTSPDRIG